MTEPDTITSKPIRISPKKVSAQHSQYEMWLVLFRNMIPVVGVFVFDWSRELTIFSYWFDGLVGLSAMIAALIPSTFAEYGTTRWCGQWRLLLYSLVWLGFVPFLCLPYWIALIVLNGMKILSPKLWMELAHSPDLWITFGFMLGSQFLQAFRRGYDKLADKEVRQQFHLLWVRAIVFFMLAKFSVLLVPIMALVLICIELWPKQVLALLDS